MLAAAVNGASTSPCNIYATAGTNATVAVGAATAASGDPVATLPTGADGGNDAANVVGNLTGTSNNTPTGTTTREAGTSRIIESGLDGEFDVVEASDEQEPPQRGRGGFKSTVRQWFNNHARQG